MLVSAIHRHESAIGIYVPFLLNLASLPIPLSCPGHWICVHCFIQQIPAGCVTYGSLCVQKSVLCVCVSIAALHQEELYEVKKASFRKVCMIQFDFN